MKILRLFLFAFMLSSLAIAARAAEEKPEPEKESAAKPNNSPAAEKEKPAKETEEKSEKAKPEDQDAEFRKVAEEYIKGWLAAHPLNATGLGFHEYDGRINDFTRLSIDAELSRLRRFDERLKKFEPEKMSPPAAVDLRILQAAIKRELFEMIEMNSFENNPMTYAQALDVNTYIKRDFSSLEDRVRSVISIENQTPNIMIAAKTNLTSNLPKPYVELAIEIARGAADFLKKDLVEALKNLKDERLIGAFQLSNRRASTALTDYAKWLETDKLPKAIGDWALGEEKYRQMLAEGELVDLPPSRVLEIGLAELKREQEAFAAAAKIIDPTKPPIDVFKEVQKEHPTPENLISETAKNLDAIRQYVIDRNIVSMPSKVRAEVKETPQFARATSFASMDTPGPFEKKASQAYYYVTPTEKEWPDQQKEEWLTAFNYFTTDVVSIHECYPGHYVQFLHLNASEASRTAKIFNSYAFVEGWAHYAEQMMIEEGFGQPKGETPSEEEIRRAAKYRLAQSDEALLRLCRLVASIKMHTQGMTVDEATKFFVENCYYEEKPAHSEAMRGTFDPGYLNYTLGKLQILKLREDYKAQEGDKFSLKKFHDELLKHGMPPIRLLREIMLKDQSKWGEVL